MSMATGSEEKEHLGFIYGVLAAASTSLMVVFVKQASDVPIFFIVFIRFFFGFLILSPLIIRKRMRLSFKHLPMHLVRGLSGFGAVYFYFFAVERIPLVTAMTLLSTAPLFIPVVIMVVYRQLVPKKRVLGVILGFIGVVVVVKPTAMQFQVGELAGLLSGILGAIALVSLRKLSRRESTATILVTYFLFCSLVSLPLSIVNWKPIEQLSSWFNLFLIAFFGVIYQFFLTKSYTHAPATKASAISYLGVVFSGLFGWLAFGEVPTLQTAVGICLILAGGLIVLYDKSQPRLLGKKKL